MGDGELLGDVLALGDVDADGLALGLVLDDGLMSKLTGIA